MPYYPLTSKKLIPQTEWPGVCQVVSPNQIWRATCLGTGSLTTYGTDAKERKVPELVGMI